MERLPSKKGWEIVEEEWPDYKGRCFKNRPRNLVEMLSGNPSTKEYHPWRGFPSSPEDFDHERV
jgi:hypothetical protein